MTTLGDCIRCWIVSASYGELVEYTWASTSASFVGDTCSDFGNCSTSYIQQDGSSILLFLAGAARADELWTSSANIVLEWVFAGATTADANVYFEYGCGDKSKTATVPSGTTTATITCTVTMDGITLTEEYD